MPLPLACPCRTDSVHYFDDKTRKPCTGICGHTVCLECVLCCHTCPVCNLEGSFSNVSVNYASIALIKDCRNQFWEKWRECTDTKNPGAGFCSKLFKETQLLCSICVEQVKIPRICLTCDEETLVKLNRWNWKENNAIVSKILHRVMCSNCAIDNHEEKGHTTVKQEMHKNSKKAITMAIAQKVLDTFKDTIENKKGVIDCFLRRLKIENIGQKLLGLFEELEYIEEWQCGYLGELIKQELIKKYMENVDETMLDLFSIQENEVCDCSRLHEKIGPGFRKISEINFLIGTKPQVFAPGCPLYSWELMADVRREYSISEKELFGVAATISPNDINCPLCVYNGYNRKIYLLLESGVSIIDEICKTEMVPLDKCCLSCLERLNYCPFLLSCEHRKKKHQSYEMFTHWYHELKQFKERKRCYQNCFIKDSSLWNFVIINHMMAGNILYEVIMYEIEQTVGFVDCHLQKVRMKETVNELFEGLNIVRFWQYFDHLSKPIEMDAHFKSFKQQWKSFRFGSAEQKAGSQCKCTVIWNNVLGKKGEIKKYEDLETRMIDMARYSITEEINECPIEYNHGIELNKDVMDQFNDIGFESTDQETESALLGNEQVKCLIKNTVSNMFPFAHLHCRNEEEQLFDNEIHQPYTGSCGHTICLVCIEKTPNGDCPVCGKRGSFENHQVNEQLVQEIKTIKENAWEMFKGLWNSEAADSGACSKCIEHSSDLNICDIDEIDDLTIWCSGGRRFLMESTADVLKLSRYVLCQECALAQAHDMRRAFLPSFWKVYLKRTNGIFLLELLEDDIGGENCEHPKTRIQINRRNIIRVWEELNYIKRGDCGYERDLIKIKLIEKLIESIDQSRKQLSMPETNPCKPIKERSCPLCVMIDFLDCAKNSIERNRNEWMDVFEHLWGSQSLRFEKCCIRCLSYLNNRYGGSCQTKTEVVNIRQMSNAISDGIEEDQLKNFEEILAFTECNDNCFMDDEKIWRNLITREYFFCLMQIMTEGLSKTTFACHMRKIRIHKLAHHFLLEVCDVWRINNDDWNVCWKFFKSSSISKNLNIEFKKLKDGMDKEGLGVKCECTEIWERIQKIMKKFGHEDCEEKRQYQCLEDSMEEMARFSPEVDLNGCPMKYSHGIKLDEESVRKLKEATHSETENKKNKCLCEEIDSLENITTISSANLDEIVSFFINWWKYEASYPHLLCHVCIDRLELIRIRLGTPPGFYDCELRRMRMLKTFEELIKFIQKFLISKGRFSKGDMEKITKVLENFISQWNSFQFGSEYDQRTRTTGTVCHCTKTLDTSRSLLYANGGWEVKREYNRLMEASKRIAEFNLSEIIVGCPLEFGHNIHIKYFNRECWNKFTDVSDCSHAS